MPTLKENIDIANKTMKEVKSIAICSNDIISKVSIPAFIHTETRQYIAQFGAEKVARYMNYQTAVKTVRSKTTGNLAEKGTLSPTAVGMLATALHGGGECHEMSMLTVMTLLDASTSSYMVNIEGKLDPDRRLGQRYGHAIVLIGSVDINRIHTLSAFQAQPKNVIVLDAFLGYVGPARDYVKDNKAYIDTFGLERAMGNYNYFDAQQLSHSVPQLWNKAKQVSQWLISQGIAKYQRHADDEPAVLKQQAFKAEQEAAPSINTYPSMLFNISHSEKQAAIFEKSTCFKVGEGNETSSASLSVKQDDINSFFREPLSSYRFKEGEISGFVPKPL